MYVSQGSAIKVDAEDNIATGDATSTPFTGPIEGILILLLYTLHTCTVYCHFVLYMYLCVYLCCCCVHMYIAALRDRIAATLSAVLQSTHPACRLCIPLREYNPFLWLL